MISLPSFVLAASAIGRVLSTVVPNVANREGMLPRTVSPTSSGIHDGYYYNFWSDGNGDVVYQNKDGGGYNVTWSGSSGTFYGGKGWNPGDKRIINYSGTFDADGTAYLSVYGWTVNPLVEYLIVENHLGYLPIGGAIKKGTVTSDGDTYDIYVEQHLPGPSIPEYNGYTTYWSVRRRRRMAGSVNTTAHFDAWAERGFRLGRHNYQIVSTEGRFSSGSSDITVS